MLLKAFKAVLPTATPEEKENIESYFQHLIDLGLEELVVYLQEFQIPLNIEAPEPPKDFPKEDSFDAAYIEYLTMFSNNCCMSLNKLISIKLIYLTDDLFLVIEEFQGDVGFRESYIKRTEQCMLEGKLVQSMDAEEIRLLLVKLVATNPVEPLWKVYAELV